MLSDTETTTTTTNQNQKNLQYFKRADSSPQRALGTLLRSVTEEKNRAPFGLSSYSRPVILLKCDAALKTVNVKYYFVPLSHMLCHGATAMASLS